VRAGAASLRPGARVVKLSSALANLAWFALSRGAARRFRRALARPRETQHALLRAYLARNADTAFGREHGFATIRDFDGFRTRVPLRDYDDLVPWIERIAAGEQGVLTAERVRLFEPSSGSTRAAKWIPYTAALQTEIRRAVAPWIDDLFSRHPRLLLGPAYWSISPSLDSPRASESVVPVGFDEDAAYLGGAARRVAQATFAVPGEVRRARDVETFRTATLLYLLRARELRLVSAWHPSFLSLLLAPLFERWDELLEHLRRGFRDPDSGVRVPPAPRRARELAIHGGPDPSRIWPRLEVVSCWGDGHAALHLKEIAALLPHVTIQPKGLIATEAFVSLPYRGAHPFAVCSHVFELLDEAGDARGLHELVEGETYSVVTTTGGGLYRYRLRDRVRVTGFVERTPSIRFLGKEDRVSDLRGEKLSEGFVAGVLDRVVDARRLRPRFAMLAPELEGPRPGYVLYLELAETAPADLPRELDTALRENPHYEHCRALSQLAPARVRRVAPDAYRRFSGRLVAAGQRLGDVKPTPLSVLDGWGAVLGEESGPPTRASVR